MGRVDPGNDEIERFVVRHYRYDPVRRERRHVVVAAFDNLAECETEIRALGEELARRSRDGTVDDRERISGFVLEPGHRGLAGNGRLLRRAAEHGSVPRDLFRIPLPRHVSLFGEPSTPQPPVRIPAQRSASAPIEGSGPAAAVRRWWASVTG